MFKADGSPSRRRAGRLAICCAVLGLVLSVPGASARQEGDSAERSFTLENGLQVFLYEKHDLPLLNVVMGVDVGSKDETDDTNGLVHILEHCILFAGTTARSGEDVSRDARQHGAYFNASTGQDISLYQISLPSAYADFALRNEKEILFDFSVTQARLDEEKAVILEEMSQMEDDPARNVQNLLMQSLFPGHPYGRPVYGRAEIIGAATLEQLMRFHARYFVPDNCALAVVGDFRCAEMEDRVRTIFGPLPRSGQAPAEIPEAGRLRKDAIVKLEKDVEEAYLALGFVAPGFNDPEQYAVRLLTEIMGRGINPLLNTALNARQIVIKTMNMGYIANRRGGAVIITLTLDPKNAAAAVRDMTRFLKTAYRENYSLGDVPGDARFYAFDYLESAKNRIRFSSEQALESGLALAESLARFMLLNDRADPGRYLDHIDEMDSGDVRKAASKVFSKGNYALVTIVPRKDRK